MRFHIKASPGNPFTILVRSQKPTINDLKAEIEERMGIPVISQRLVFSGEVLDNGWVTIEECGIPDESTIRLVAEEVVDIAALSKDKGTGSQAEVGSKRAREDSSSSSLSSTPPSYSNGLLSCGAMRVQGRESFWDEEDFGLAWRKSRPIISPHDAGEFESKSPHMLIESVANECVHTLNVMALLERQLEEYRDKLSPAEDEVKYLSRRNADVEYFLHKEKECVQKVMEELDVERSTGTSFLQSEDGRRYVVTLERRAAKRGVDEFTKTAAFAELVMDRAVDVYDDAVMRCQTLLRESGRVSEDIIQLIGKQEEMDHNTTC